MNTSDLFIKNKLDERLQNGSYRELQPENDLVDFCSNDYLGFGRSPVLKELISDELTANSSYKNGSTGSRLISGNSSYIENLEKEIAVYHNAEAGLIYNSGYDANLGLFSCLPQRGDTVITDEYIHASIIDGIRLSNANRYSFKHNDLNALEEKLKHARGNCYIVTESVYSMDGDMPDLPLIIALAEQYNARLIVDEAHALGLFAKGLVNELNLEDKIFARIVTFGKALGCHGAIILGSHLLREYLINFSRSFIYTTAPPFYQFAAVKCAYQLLKKSERERNLLIRNIELFKGSLTRNPLFNIIQSDSPIQCILTGSNAAAKQAAKTLQTTGFDVRAILSPTVPAGTERLRVCLHSFNSMNEIKLLAEHINHIISHG